MDETDANVRSLKSVQVPNLDCSIFLPEVITDQEGPAVCIMYWSKFIIIISFLRTLFLRLGLGLVWVFLTWGFIDFCASVGKFHENFELVEILGLGCFAFVFSLIWLSVGWWSFLTNVVVWDMFSFLYLNVAALLHVIFAVDTRESTTDLEPLLEG